MKFLFTLLLLLPCLVLGQQTGSQKKYDPPFNLLDNGNFEKKTSGWTQSGGTFAHVTSGSNLIFDKGSATFDASATSQYIQTKLYTVTEGLKSASCMARVYYKGGDSNLVLKVLDGSSNLLGSATFAASTATLPLSAAFPCPSSGSIRLRIESTANAAIVAIDNAHVGVADSMLKVSQATLVGAASIYAASCSWSTSSTSLVEPAADTDCPGPIIDVNSGPGVIDTTDTDLPRFTVNNLPPADYVAVMTLVANAGTGNAGFAIDDGVNVRGRSGGDGTQNRSATIIAHYSYSTAGNHTFKLLINNTSDTTTINANDLSSAWRLNFALYKYPSIQDQAFSAAQVANSWSGYHATTCDFQNTSASWVDFNSDATCSLVERTNTNFGTVTSALSSGDPIPGIVFTPSRVSTYQICALTQAGNSTAAQNISLRLYDGTSSLVEVNSVGKVSGSYSEVIPLCAIYKATDVSPKTIKIQGQTGGGTMSISGSFNGSGINAIEWRIFQIDQSLPAPVYSNTVVSPSSGVEGIARASVSNTGTVSNESGDWINGNCAVSGGGSNVYTCTLNSYFSATPVCVASIDDDLGAGEVRGGANSSTTIVFTTSSSAGADSDRSFNMICMGSK